MDQIIYSEPTITINDRRFIIKDSFRFNSDEQKTKLMNILQEYNKIFMHRPNDNNIYIIEEIPIVEAIPIVEPTQLAEITPISETEITATTN